MTNEEKILEMLGTINDRLGRLETAQDKMQAAQEQMQAKQDKMQEDLDTVKTTQDKMQENLDGVRKDLDTVKTTQDKMEKDLTRVRGILEVEVDLKIRGLFDGHAMLNDKLERLDGIEKKLEEVSVQVDAIRPTVKEHTRELAQMKRVQ